MRDELSTPQAIQESLISPNEQDRNGEAANVVDGLFAIARSIDRLAIGIERLGIAEAVTPMGAIEYLATQIKRGCDVIAETSEHKGGA